MSEKARHADGANYESGSKRPIDALRGTWILIHFLCVDLLIEVAIE